MATRAQSSKEGVNDPMSVERQLQEIAWKWKTLGADGIRAFSPIFLGTLLDHITSRNAVHEGGGR